MARLGGFETSPYIAVALSGGADSTALLHLLKGWTAKHGGRLAALVVDHGLRAGVAAEARLVRARARAAGIDCHILTWRGKKPASAVQEAARAARYRLLGDWCENHGVLHLAVAHHHDDQLETIHMRARRESGPDGLAGMSAIRETGWGRIIRPCLSFSRSDLRESLMAQAIPWVEDPSNQNLAFERVRVRRALSGGSPEFVSVDGAPGARVATDRAAARFLAGAAMISPLGYAEFDLEAFRRLSDETGRRVIGALCAAIGGLEYSPRRARIDTVRDALCGGEFRGRTLGGCRLSEARGNVLITREAGRCAMEKFAVNAEMFWDNRFRLGPAPGPRGVCVGPLLHAGQEERGKIRRLSPIASRIPAAAFAALPAFFRGETLLAVPHLGYGRSFRYDRLLAVRVRFRPKRSVSNAPFAVV